MADFVHLHNHSDYSLLDAAQTVEMMCNRVYDLNMDSIAITDHGNLFAMLPFYQQAKKTGINLSFVPQINKIGGRFGRF